jgi:hypothetical protein
VKSDPQPHLPVLAARRQRRVVAAERAVALAPHESRRRGHVVREKQLCERSVARLDRVVLERGGPVGKSTPVVADHVVTAVNQADTRQVVERRDAAGERVAAEHVVGIEPREVATAGTGDAAVPVARDPDVLALTEDP